MSPSTSPNHLVSGTAAERVRPFSFDRPDHRPPPPAPAATALHIEHEVERRSRELVEQIREEARQAGYAEGATTARLETESVLDALRQAVEAANRSTEQALDDLARCAVTVGVAIAEAVVGRAVVEDPAAMFDPIRRAVRELEGDDDIVLRLHPTDHRVLRGVMAEQSGAGGRPSSAEVAALLSSVRVVDDSTITPGSCRVESAVRIAIDGVEKRLDDIRRAVEGP